MWQKDKRSTPGIEPGTSSTLKMNHTPRPSGLRAPPIFDIFTYPTHCWRMDLNTPHWRIRKSIRLHARVFDQSQPTESCHQLHGKRTSKRSTYPPGPDWRIEKEAVTLHHYLHCPCNHDASQIYIDLVLANKCFCFSILCGTCSPSLHKSTCCCEWSLHIQWCTFWEWQCSGCCHSCYICWGQRVSTNERC